VPQRLQRDHTESDYALVFAGTNTFRINAAYIVAYCILHQADARFRRNNMRFATRSAADDKRCRFQAFGHFGSKNSSAGRSMSRFNPWMNCAAS
jgi:hypothetical protein